MAKLPLFLTLNGDGTTKNLNGNYAAPTRAWVEADVIQLNPKNLNVFILDSDSTLTTYGNLAALTNGVQIKLEKFDGTNWTTIKDFTLNDPIKKTSDWAKFTNGLDPLQSTTATPGTMVQFPLDGLMSIAPATGARLTVTLNDDLSGLDYHSFCLA